MLSIKNSEDQIKMMNYHRTKDMLNLMNFFPDLSPICDLIVIESIDEYEKNKRYFDTFSCIRNDTIISKPSMISISGNDYFGIFQKVKSIDSDGVIVLFNLNHKPSKRYERLAGISIGVSVGNEIYIDAVGKGFDGREVSKGLYTHERYIIPWYEIRNCSIDNFHDYQTYFISQIDYEKTRFERIIYLKSSGFINDDDVIPKEYQSIPNVIWADIIKNIIKKLDKMEDELLSAKLNEFALSGHTEGERFLPWQMFDKSRYMVGE